MVGFNPGLVHTPVTPFTDKQRIDFSLYEKILEFHLANGADSLALPMHVGESVSLTDSERLELLEFAIKKINNRVPIIAHVSQSGTRLATDLAENSQSIGASAIIATTPYYWKPQPAMMLEHFETIGAAVSIPYFLYNTPDEMGGTHVTTDLTIKLLEKLDNFIGVVDLSLDWQFMIDLISTAQRTRPDFQLLSGMEYLISAGAIGATGTFAPHAGIAPKLVRTLYDLFREERYEEARKPQEEMAILFQHVKLGGVAAIKAAMQIVGRECGTARDPLLPLTDEAFSELNDQITNSAGLAEETHGW